MCDGKCSGILKKDLYAGCALLGLIIEASSYSLKSIDWKEVAVRAHQIADLMVEAGECATISRK